MLPVSSSARFSVGVPPALLALLFLFCAVLGHLSKKSITFFYLKPDDAREMKQPTERYHEYQGDYTDTPDSPATPAVHSRVFKIWNHILPPSGMCTVQYTKRRGDTSHPGAFS